MAKGQKVCPKCNKACGPRTKVCSCSHIFEFKAKKTYTKSDKSDIIVKPKVLRNFVYAPGTCPIKITKTMDIRKWLEKVQCLKSNGLLFSRRAIISWLIGYPEFIKYVREHMNEYNDCLAYEEQINAHILKIYKTPRKRYV